METLFASLVDIAGFSVRAYQANRSEWQCTFVCIAMLSVGLPAAVGPPYFFSGS
jgi:hypothetical protein